MAVLRSQQSLRSPPVVRPPIVPSRRRRSRPPSRWPSSSVEPAPNAPHQPRGLRSREGWTQRSRPSPVRAGGRSEGDSPLPASSPGSLVSVGGPESIWSSWELIPRVDMPSPCHLRPDARRRRQWWRAGADPLRESAGSNGGMPRCCTVCVLDRPARRGFAAVRRGRQRSERERLLDARLGASSLALSRRRCSGAGAAGLAGSASTTNTLLRESRRTGDRTPRPLVLEVRRSRLAGSLLRRLAPGAPPARPGGPSVLAGSWFSPLRNEPRKRGEVIPRARQPMFPAQAPQAARAQVD